VVLLFVQLEAVLLAIEQCSVESADEAQRVLVLLDLLPLLSEGSKLIDDNSTQYLLNDHFY
jgi:hypothetical protein